jgi:hypothetical protein
MPKPEDALKAQVIAYLNQTGTFYLRLNSGKLRVKRGFMQLAPEGTADFLVCNPDPRWLELKAPGQGTKKARQVAQAAFAGRVLRLGHKHAYCTSVDEVKAFLEGI